MNKQIEEMAKAIFETGEAIEEIDLRYACLHGADNDSETKFMRIARHLYRNGYRKTTDVAREIFEDLTDIFKDIPMWGAVAVKKIADLKKKYESEGVENA